MPFGRRSPSVLSRIALASKPTAAAEGERRSYALPAALVGTGTSYFEGIELVNNKVIEDARKGTHVAGAVEVAVA